MRACKWCHVDDLRVCVKCSQRRWKLYCISMAWRTFLLLAVVVSMVFGIAAALG